MKALMAFLRIVSLSGMLISQRAFSHEGHEHHEQPSPEHAEFSQDLKMKYAQINERYQQAIKPIFDRSCVACHGENSPPPWYHVFPYAGGLIDTDIAEAKKHLDFTSGFPFRSHASPTEDLDAIEKSVSDGTMPPLRYRVMHWGAALSSRDEVAIRSWVSESKALLNEHH